LADFDIFSVVFALGGALVAEVDFALVDLLCFSVVAALAIELIVMPNAKRQDKTKIQNRFTCIPKYLPKLSTYRMINNFDSGVSFINPKHCK
jgi:hypothetical protein